MHLLGIGTRIEAGKNSLQVTKITKEGITLTELRKDNSLSKKTLFLDLDTATQMAKGAH